MVWAITLGIAAVVLATLGSIYSPSDDRRGHGNRFYYGFWVFAAAAVVLFFEHFIGSIAAVLLGAGLAVLFLLVWTLSSKSDARMRQFARIGKCSAAIAAAVALIVPAAWASSILFIEDESEPALEAQIDDVVIDPEDTHSFGEGSTDSDPGGGQDYSDEEVRSVAVAPSGAEPLQCNTLDMTITNSQVLLGGLDGSSAEAAHQSKVEGALRNHYTLWAYLEFEAEVEGDDNIAAAISGLERSDLAYEAEEGTWCLSREGEELHELLVEKWESAEEVVLVSDTGTNFINTGLSSEGELVYGTGGPGEDRRAIRYIYPDGKVSTPTYVRCGNPAIPKEPPPVRLPPTPTPDPDPKMVEVCDPSTGEVITVPEDEADQYLPPGHPACKPEDPDNGKDPADDPTPPVGTVPEDNDPPSDHREPEDEPPAPEPDPIDLGETPGDPGGEEPSPPGDGPPAEQPDGPPGPEDPVEEDVEPGDNPFDPSPDPTIPPTDPPVEENGNGNGDGGNSNQESAPSSEPAEEIGPVEPAPEPEPAPAPEPQNSDDGGQVEEETSSDSGSFLEPEGVEEGQAEESEPNEAGLPVATMLFASALVAGIARLVRNWFEG